MGSGRGSARALLRAERGGSWRKGVRLTGGPRKAVGESGALVWMAALTGGPHLAVRGGGGALR